MCLNKNNSSCWYLKTSYNYLTIVIKVGGVVMENGKVWVNNCITAYHNHTIIIKLCVLKKIMIHVGIEIFLQLSYDHHKSWGVLMPNVK